MNTNINNIYIITIKLFKITNNKQITYKTKNAEKSL